MNKNLAISLIVCLCVLLVGCSPTCTDENIWEATAELKRQYTEFDRRFNNSIDFVKEQPSMTSLAIIDFQDQREVASLTPIPKCVESVKTSTLTYMDSAIDVLVLLENGASDGEIELALQNTEHQRQAVESEFESVLTR